MNLTLTLESINIQFELTDTNSKQIISQFTFNNLYSYGNFTLANYFQGLTQKLECKILPIYSWYQMSRFLDFNREDGP